MEKSAKYYPHATPLKAIKAKCLECSAGSLKEVKLCTRQDCPLYPFRLGTNPFIKKSHQTQKSVL